MLRAARLSAPLAAVVIAGEADFPDHLGVGGHHGPCPSPPREKVCWWTSHSTQHQLQKESQSLPEKMEKNIILSTASPRLACKASSMMPCPGQRASYGERGGGMRPPPFDRGGPSGPPGFVSHRDLDFLRCRNEIHPGKGAQRKCFAGPESCHCQLPRFICHPGCSTCDPCAEDLRTGETYFIFRIRIHVASFLSSRQRGSTPRRFLVLRLLYRR